MSETKDKTYKTLKSMYWSKVHKKNVQKQVTTKKFKGDEEKAREFLNNWKAESVRKDLAIFNKSKNADSEKITTEKDDNLNVEEPVTIEEPEIQDESHIQIKRNKRIHEI